MQAADINSAEPVTEHNDAPPRAAKWYRRVGFWRALAGMALALALACAIVALETSSEMMHRSASYHRRLVQLVARIRQMRGEMATADQRIAGMRNEAAVGDRLGRILAAPDARLIRLGAPGAGPSGLVAISRDLASAVCEVSNLPPARVGQSYMLWWMVEQRGPVKAAQFQTTADGHATVIAQLPGRENPSAAIVTVQPDDGTGKPAGAVKLKGAMAAAAARPAAKPSGRVKTR
jgi:hypothetical protein